MDGAIQALFSGVGYSLGDPFKVLLFTRTMYTYTFITLLVRQMGAGVCGTADGRHTSAQSQCAVAV